MEGEFVSELRVFRKALGVFKGGLLGEVLDVLVQVFLELLLGKPEFISVVLNVIAGEKFLIIPILEERGKSQSGFFSVLAFSLYCRTISDLLFHFLILIFDISHNHSSLILHTM